MSSPRARVIPSGSRSHLTSWAARGYRRQSGNMLTTHAGRRKGSAHAPVCTSAPHLGSWADSCVPLSAPANRARFITPQWVTRAGHRPGGGATRLTSMTSSPKPLIRSISPDRAPRSGSSVRRVVVPGPMVTSQSSNSARSVLLARPRKVISYVCACTGFTPPGPPSSCYAGF